MRKLSLFLILLSALAGCKALLPSKILPYSMVKYQNERFVDATEITVEQWAEFVFDGNESFKPDSTISKQFSYHELFYPSSPPDSLYRAFGKLNYYNLPVIKQYFDTLNYAQLRNILDVPITGISFADAQAYCQWRTNRYNNELTDHSKQRITYVLPESIEMEPIQELYITNDKGRKEPALNRAGLEYERDKDAPNMITAKAIGYQPTQVTAMPPNAYEVFGIYDNVAEMSNIEGQAYGGSYLTEGDELVYNISYNQPEPWLGFRCVGIVQ